jgi:hypothetical protein
MAIRFTEKMVLPLRMLMGLKFGIFLESVTEKMDRLQNILMEIGFGAFMESITDWMVQPLSLAMVKKNGIITARG